MGWCEKYPDIDHLLPAFDEETTRGAGGGTSPKPSPEQGKKLKEDLLQTLNTPLPPVKNPDNKPVKK